MTDKFVVKLKIIGIKIWTVEVFLFFCFISVKILLGWKSYFLSVFEEATRISRNNIPLFLKFDINALDFKINVGFPGIIVVAA